MFPSMYPSNSTFIHENISSGLSPWTVLTSSEAVDFYKWTPLILMILIFIVPFLGPIILAVTIYFCSIIMWVESLYRAINRLTKEVDDSSGKNKSFKVVGKRNLPQNSPAVLVFYQGSLPIDILYFTSHLWRRHRRSIYVLTHKKQYAMKGWKRFNKRMNYVPMSRKNCVQNLFNGHDIILPLQEDMETKNTSEKYLVNWNGKNAFAAIAKAAKVPIIPVFTRNIQEAFWIPWFLKKVATGKRYPIVAGGLPVKLITYIGEPILYDETESTKELANKVAKEIQKLIDQHQMIPGNKFDALFDRLWLDRKEPKQTSFTVQCKNEGFPELNNSPKIEEEDTVFTADWTLQEVFSEFINSPSVSTDKCLDESS
uniref:Phospholipid/glycerol acyltransferase domain-containing protein n=1 Tax=Strigamia maritima TaxID=126957 RepID=T1ISZ2_STRMM